MNPSDIALVHHWLVTWRGGEIVLGEIMKLFPASPIHTLVAGTGKHRLTEFDHTRIITSPLQYLPFSRTQYRKLLPLHPAAIALARRSFKAKFAISTDASMIKGLVPEGVPHVCYCHSPPRYLWDMQAEYAAQSNELNSLGRLVFNSTAKYCREFDRRSASHVSHFIANSNFVRARIQTCYDRDAVVINPPCEVDDFNHRRPRENFYLIVSHLTPYKRVDIAVRACTQLNRPLVVIGVGNELDALKKIAGPSVQFLQKLSRPQVTDYFERCAAFFYPQVEDFGITAVEAQAAGAPVIAYRAGGALESVIENETGIFFDQQTPDSLADAILRFEHPDTRAKLTPESCRANALRFAPEHFRNKIKSFLLEKYPRHFATYPWPELPS